MQSRAAALGWGAVTQVVVVVGSTPPGATAPVLTDLHRAARRTGVELLVAIHGPRIICIGGSVTDPMALATALDPHLGDGPLVVGPVVPHLFAAGPQRPGRDLRAQRGTRLAGGAPAGARRRPARRAGHARRPARARGALIARIVRPLAESPGGTLLDTAAAFLDGAHGRRGHRPHADRAPQHGALPAGRHHQGGRLRPHRRPRRPDRAHRAGLPPARPRLAVDRRGPDRHPARARFGGNLQIGRARFVRARHEKVTVGRTGWNT